MYSFPNLLPTVIAHTRCAASHTGEKVLSLLGRLNSEDGGLNSSTVRNGLIGVDRLHVCGRYGIPALWTIHSARVSYLPHLWYGHFAVREEDGAGQARVRVGKPVPGMFVVDCCH